MQQETDRSSIKIIRLAIDPLQSDFEIESYSIR